jgi:hypothetical protein
VWSVSGIRQEARPEGTAVPKVTHRTATIDRAQLQLPERCPSRSPNGQEPPVRGC